MPEPKPTSFNVESKIIRTGYSPRNIRQMRTAKAFLVGCKDGSLEVIRLDEDNPIEIQNQFTIYEGGDSPENRKLTNRIWSFCEFSENHIIYGTNNGDIRLVYLDWDKSKYKIVDSLSVVELWRQENKNTSHLSASIKPEPVKYIGQLYSDDKATYLLISCELLGSTVVKVEKDMKSFREILQRKKSFACLDEVKNLGFAARLIGRNSKNQSGSGENSSEEISQCDIFISRNGDAWISKNIVEENLENAGDPKKNKTLKYVNLWKKEERPAFLEDFALVKACRELDSTDNNENESDGEGLYVSSDLGVFWINPRYNSEENLGKIKKARQIFLPGISKQSMGITQFSLRVGSDVWHYLWVSDSSGDSSLYYCRAQVIKQIQNGTIGTSTGKDSNAQRIYLPKRGSAWKLSRVIHDNSQVLHACVGRSLTKSKGFLVLKTCRDDRIVINHYKSVFDNPDNTKDKIFGILNGCENLYDLMKALVMQEFSNDKKNCAELNKHADLIFCRFLELIAKETTNEGSTLLELFLKTPNPGIAHKILDNINLDKWPGVIKIWTYTLMSLVNRFDNNRKDEAYQGLVQWLRKIATDKNSDPENSTNKPEFYNTIERCIQFVRKWGINGRSLQARTRIAGLDSLLKQETVDTQNWVLDKLALSGILFHKKVDHLAGWPLKINKVVSPYGVVCDVNHLIFAWNIPDKKEGHITRYPINNVLDDRVGDKSRTMSISDEYSHIVQLANGKILLMTEEGKYVIVDVDKEVESPRRQIASFENDCERNQKIRKVKYLEGDRLLIGLETKGNAQILIKMVQDTTLMDIGAISYTQITPKGKSGVSVNSVDAIAHYSTGARDFVVVGCSDGQVWLTPLKRFSSDNYGGVYNIIDTSALQDGAQNNCLVGRIGNPIKSIEISLQSTHAVVDSDRENEILRIFVGTCDGVIIAYQSILEISLTDKTRFHDKFTTLWSTQEQGAIVGMHSFDFYDKGKIMPMVLALSDRGNGTLFSNIIMSETIDAKRRDEHFRPILPGSRHARFKTHETVVCSWVLTKNQKSSLMSKFKEPNNCLIFASKSGQIHFFEMFYPGHTQLRHEALQSIEKDIKSVLNCPKKSYYELRKVDAIYGASPVPSLYYIRAILQNGLGPESILYGCIGRVIDDQELVKKDGLSSFRQDNFFFREALPPQYHSIWDMYLEWLEVGKYNYSSEKFVECFSKALNTAFELRDSVLYKEIIRVTLLVINKKLFFSSLKNENVENNFWSFKFEDEMKIYQSILSVLSSLHGIWESYSHEINDKVNMICVRNLLDGDTMWSITKAIKACVKDDKINYETVLSKQINQLRLYLTMGNPLLALETLRACNHSMQRACIRIQLARIKKKSKLEHRSKEDNSIYEFPWNIYRDFFGCLCDVSARLGLDDGNFDVPFKHEITKCFALGIFLIPSASMALAHYFAEACLPKSFIELIKDQYLLIQFQLSDHSGFDGNLYKRQAFLFFIATDLDFSRRSIFKNFLNDDLMLTQEKKESLTLDKDFSHFINLAQEYLADNSDLELSAEILWNLYKYYLENDRVGKLSSINSNSTGQDFLDLLSNVIGSENYKIFEAFKCFQGIYDYFVTLCKAHSENAKNIDLSESKIQNVFNFNILSHDAKIIFSHSLEFWNKCAKDFELKLKDFNIKKSEDVIRPEIVLFSIKLQEWAGDCRRILENDAEKKNLFDPFVTTWNILFQNLENAAQKFPSSAAIQQNIVLGVLGHGLLEALDEHVFEMEEVAQALDPVGIWLFSRDGSTHKDNEENIPQSVEQKLAFYLVERAHHSESVPKNLRILQDIFQKDDFEESRTIDKKRYFVKDVFGGMREDGFSFEDSLDESTEDSVACLLPSEMPYLRLITSELYSNHVDHGPKDKGKPIWRCCGDVDHPSIEFKFPLLEYDSRGRLEDLIKLDLQLPTRPRTDRKVPSHGLGLYLANLAAAVIGWKLQIEISAEEAKLKFTLTRVAKVEMING